MSSYAEQQRQLDQIAEELTRNNDLWKQDEFGGVSNGPTTRPRRDDMDFGGMVNSEKISLRPKDFTAADFEELGRRDPAFKAKLDEQNIYAVTDAFRKATPMYLATTENYEAMLKYIRNTQLQDPYLDIDDTISEAYAKGFWTVENLTVVFKTLKAKGKLDMPAETAKELTHEEKLIVTSKVRTGNPEEAIMSYLQFALPSRDVRYMTMETFAMEYPALLHKTVWTVFQMMHPELSPEEFRVFARSMRHVALPTIATLENSLYLKKEERFISRTAPAPAQASPSPESEEPRELTEDELRSLPTEELDKLIAQEKKEVRRRMYRL